MNHYSLKVTRAIIQTDTESTRCQTSFIDDPGERPERITADPFSLGPPEIMMASQGYGPLSYRIADSERIPSGKETVSLEATLKKIKNVTQS